jgi:hypothetical protein
MVCAAGGDPAILHDELQMGLVRQQAQVVERVGIQDDQVGGLALLDGSQPRLPAEQAGACCLSQR